MAIRRYDSYYGLAPLVSCQFGKRHFYLTNLKNPLMLPTSVDQ